MGPFALIMLLVTGLAGTMVLVEWYDDERRRAPNGTMAVVVTHATLALISLVVMAVFLTTRRTTLGSATVVVLLATAAFGVTAFLRSRRGQPNRGRAGDVGRGFLLFHGAAATLTIVVALVAVLASR
ncbi:MAG: hypothetical protein JO265_16550 [Acidimicrobiia bacterium]|nr:hypothetical protein [Acidimicrobiia bacterium]